MRGILDWLAIHKKLAVFITGAALTLAVQAWGADNPWVSLAVLAATGLGVYQAPNRPAPARRHSQPPP